MSRRENTTRCARCRLPEPVCVCAMLPRLETHARVVVVMHHGESVKPTNTGGLAQLCLVNSALEVLDDRDVPRLAASADAILFPSEGALPVSTLRLGATLLVPDGTWRQARKIARRLCDERPDLPRVALPSDTPPTQYRLRSERRAGGLSTLEAIARALEILEGKGERGGAVCEQLLRAQRVFVDRTLWLRGTLRDDEVTGGLPPGAGVARGGASDRVR